MYYTNATYVRCGGRQRCTGRRAGCCCIWAVSVLYGAAIIALGVTGIVFFARLANDDRTAQLEQYQKAIDAWDGGLATEFISAMPMRNFSLSIAPRPQSPNMVSVAGVYPLPASQYRDPFRSSDPEGGVPTAKTFANFHAALNKDYMLPGSISSALQLIFYGGPTGATPFGSFAFSAWQVATFSESCTRSCSGSNNNNCHTTCSCKDGSHDNGDGTCSLWFRLNEICVVVDPGTRGLPDTLSSPAGCALIESRQSTYLGTGPFDIAGYSVQGSPPNTGGQYAFNPPVTVRSSADPLVQLLRITGGKLEFPFSQAKKLGIALGCFIPAVVLVLIALLVVCPLWCCEANVFTRDGCHRALHSTCPCCYDAEFRPPPLPAYPHTFSRRGVRTYGCCATRNDPPPLQQHSTVVVAGQSATEPPSGAIAYNANPMAAPYPGAAAYPGAPPPAYPGAPAPQPYPGQYPPAGYPGAAYGGYPAQAPPPPPGYPYPPPQPQQQQLQLGAAYPYPGPYPQAGGGSAPPPDYGDPQPAAAGPLLQPESVAPEFPGPPSYGKA